MAGCKGTYPFRWAALVHSLKGVIDLDHILWRCILCEHVYYVTIANLSSLKNVTKKTLHLQWLAEAFFQLLFMSPNGNCIRDFGCNSYTLWLEKITKWSVLYYSDY